MKQGTRINSTITRLVMGADFVIMNIVLIALYNLTPAQLPNYFKLDTSSFMIVANASMVVAQYCFYNIMHRRFVDFEMFAKRVLKLVLTNIATMFIIFAIIGKEARGNMIHFLVFYGCIMYVVLVLSRVLERALLKYMRRKGNNYRRAIFVGDDPALKNIYESMCDDMSMEYNVKGYFSNKEMIEAPKGLERLGTLDELMAMINSELEGKELEDDNELKCKFNDNDEVFCSLSHSENETITAIMRYCDHHFIHFLYVPRTLGNIQLKLKVTYFGGYMIYTNHPEPLQMFGNRLVKRAFDVAFSSVVCLCMLPFIPIIALIIKCQSRGPIFFGQDRTGYNGKTFKCWKFRSMHVNANADKVQATKDDPRKFAFGNFMRSTSIDELPQFFNVLKGDMSIVGPRPHMLHHTDIYSQLIEKYMVRHLSKPGITGWAQVTGYRGETKELWQMEERVKRDIWYIENWSFWLDIKIVFMTAFGMFFKNKNAY